jgi:hypothetical protein
MAAVSIRPPDFLAKIRRPNVCGAALRKQGRRGFASAAAFSLPAQVLAAF